MPALEFIEWMGFYQVQHQIRTNTLPPREFLSPTEQSAAIRGLFGK